MAAGNGCEASEPSALRANELVRAFLYIYEPFSHTHVLRSTQSFGGMVVHVRGARCSTR
jgi:hypothetical protein